MTYHLYTDAIITALHTRDEPLKFDDLLIIIGVTKHGSGNEEWRKVDRALQRLRKAGRIEFMKGKGAGWRLPAKKQAEAT